MVVEWKIVWFCLAMHAYTHFQVEYMPVCTYEYVYVGITFMTDVFGSIYIHQLSSCNFPQNIFIAIELGGW